jgi:hypothetical protein
MINMIKKIKTTGRKKMITLTGLLALLTVVGCSGMPAQRVEVVNMPTKRPAITRSEKYFVCVVELNREGIKQSLIKELCDSGLGSL